MAQRQTSILVVDDDERFVDFLALLLDGAGYHAVTAASAEEAVERARHAPPEAAVLDVVMPGRGGYSLCRELRDQIDPTLPVIFVSGERTEAMDRAAGILVGGDDYMVKPVHAEELLARLQRLLERSRGCLSGRRLDLSEREIEVLQLIAEGWPPADLARHLHIAPKTISSHVQRIFGKLDVHTRAQAVAVAYEAGAIRVDGRLRDNGEVEAHRFDALDAA